MDTKGKLVLMTKHYYKHLLYLTEMSMQKLLITEMTLRE